MTAMSKTILKALGVIVALSFAGLPAQAQTKVTGGIAAFNEALLPVFTAREKGYFEAEGFSLDLVDFKGGGPAVQALAAGSIDICVCAADHVIRLRARRRPALVLVGLDEFHSYALVSKASAPFTDLVSLKGKKIGITAPGSLTDNTIRASIKALGLNPDRDFEIISGGVGATMQAAIDFDRIDAGLVIVTDFANMSQKKGAYKVVVDYREMPYPSFDALVLASFVQARPKEAKGFAKAVLRAMADLQADPELGRRILAGMFPNFSSDLVAEVAKSAIARAPKGGVVSADSLESLNKIVLSSDDTLKAITMQEAFDPSLLKD